MANFSRRHILTTGALAAAGLTATSGLANGSSAQSSPPGSEPQAVAVNNPTGRFASKVILITGATSGIGKATAKAFAQEGGSVCFCGRRENLGHQVEAEILAAGGEAKYMKADVRNAAEVKAFVESCINKYGLKLAKLYLSAM